MVCNNKYECSNYMLFSICNNCYGVNKKRIENEKNYNYNRFNFYFLYKNGNMKIDFSQNDYYFRYTKKHYRKIGKNFEMDKKRIKNNHFKFINQIYLYSDGAIINNTIFNNSIHKRLRKYIL